VVGDEAEDVRDRGCDLAVTIRVGPRVCTIRVASLVRPLHLVMAANFFKPGYVGKKAAPAPAAKHVADPDTQPWVEK
jgi:hypothetical protein